MVVPVAVALVAEASVVPARPFAGSGAAAVVLESMLAANESATKVQLVTLDILQEGLRQVKAVMARDAKEHKGSLTFNL